MKVTKLVFIASLIFSNNIFSKELLKEKGKEQSKGQISFIFDNYFNRTNFSDTLVETNFLVQRNFLNSSFQLDFDVLSFNRDRKSSYYNIKKLLFSSKNYFKTLEIIFGFQIFDWGVTEIFKPNDLVNSTIFNTNFDEREKRGEFAISVSKNFGKGTFNFNLFPLVLKNIYPSNISVYSINNYDLENISLVAKNKKNLNLQFSIGYEYSSKNWELFTFFISHYDRLHPLIGTTKFAETSGQPVPIDSISFSQKPEVHFFKENVLGLNLESKYMDFNFKMELNAHFPVSDKKVLTISGVKKGQRYFEQAFGMEYNLTNSRGGESLFFFEVSFLNQTKDPFVEEASFFQSDFAVGVKYYFHNDSNQIIKCFYLSDFKNPHEKIFILEYENFLNEYWKFNSLFKLIRAPLKNKVVLGLENFNNLDMVSLSLTRVF